MLHFGCHFNGLTSDVLPAISNCRKVFLVAATSKPEIAFARYPQRNAREGVSLYVNCSHPACGRSGRVNLDMLIEKLGGDHGAMHHDLVGKFACSACPVEGRDIRPVFFTIVQNYEREQQERNARWERPAGQS